MEIQIVDRTIKTLEMPDTVATRKYPFTQKTLDQIREIRESRQDIIYNESGEEIIVPAPIVIADAINLLHTEEIKHA